MDKRKKTKGQTMIYKQKDKQYTGTSKPQFTRKSNTITKKSLKIPKG